MPPYEIRQRHDGSIDYNNYIARPVRLLTPNLHRFCRQASLLKSLLLAAATVAALVYAASHSTHRTACAQCAPVNVSVPARS